MKTNRAVSVTIIMLILGSCVGVPEGIKPVQNFDVKRYMGAWYEISGLDHRFD